MNELLAQILFIVVAFAIVLAVVYGIFKMIPFWVRLLLIILTATGLITLEHWKGVAVSVITFTYTVVVETAAAVFGRG